jgi:hypothetical protein
LLPPLLWLPAVRLKRLHLHLHQHLSLLLHQHLPLLLLLLKHQLLPLLLPLLLQKHQLLPLLLPHLLLLLPSKFLLSHKKAAFGRLFCGRKKLRQCAVQRARRKSAPVFFLTSSRRQ